MRPHTPPRLHLSGRLVDLRALVACYGDIPLLVLARDLERDPARDYPPARLPARVPARYP